MLVFAASIRLLIVPPDEDGWFHIDLERFRGKGGTGLALLLLLLAMVVLGSPALLGTIPHVGGELARGEMSPFPWDQFVSQEQRRPIQIAIQGLR